MAEMKGPRDLQPFIQGLKSYALAKGRDLTTDTFDELVVDLEADLMHAATTLTQGDINDIHFRAAGRYNLTADADHQVTICSYVIDGKEN